MSKTYGFLAGLLLSITGLAIASDEATVIIDVRTLSEYKEEHIGDALHMPYDEIGTLIGEKVKDKNSKIIVYCKSGRRAGIAKETLESMGFTHVENAGGLEDMKSRLKAE